MRKVLGFLAVLAATATPPLAEPDHGTILTFTIEGNSFAVQFWTGDNKIIVARRDDEVGKGAFPAQIAARLADAALAQQNMEDCSRSAPQPYMDIPGLWEIFYRCQA